MAESIKKNNKDKNKEHEKVLIFISDLRKYDKRLIGMVDSLCSTSTSVITNTLSEIQSFLGASNSIVEDDLKKIKQKAIQRIKKYAYSKGGNAIINFKISFYEFKLNIFCVCYGTAVFLKNTS